MTIPPGRSVDCPDDLEKPPEIPRRLLLNWRQGIGLIFLLAIPVLALLRFLGDGKSTVEERAQGLAVRAEVPVSARYGNMLQLRLTITAEPSIKMRHVNVEVSTDYLAGFSDIHAQPEIVRSTANASVIPQDVPPGGEGAPVLIELTPEKPGWSRGFVRVSAESGEAVELPLKTFIFP